jgi:hypothetical protein
VSRRADAGAELVSSGWRQRLAAPAVAVLAVLCCLGAPLVVGGIGALTTGALVGGLVGAALLALVCFLILRRLTATRGRC